MEDMNILVERAIKLIDNNKIVLGEHQIPIQKGLPQGGILFIL